jgi:phenylalanyl-tRNA synthetase beta chain
MLDFLKTLFSSPSKTHQFQGIITARVVTIEKHPNADRLQVVRLTDGNKEIYPVVCGAFNFKEGDIVALALPGAFIPHNIHSDAHESFTLGTAKIRGVESHGMICASFELGLSKEAGDGIMVLPQNTKIGVPLEQIV